MSVVFSPAELQKAVLPLKLIFWGGIICILDFTIDSTSSYNGGGSAGCSFDLINDFAGMLMITWGVFELSNYRFYPQYDTIMKWLRIVAVVACIEAIEEHFLYENSSGLSLLFILLYLVQMVSIWGFCVAMRWLSLAGELERAADSWRFTTKLFVWIYLIPTVLFSLVRVMAILDGGSGQIELGPAWFLVLPIIAVPFIHLFVSISRMKSAIALGPLSE